MKEVMHFHEQNKGEKILMVIRKHWIVYVRLFIIFFFIFIFPILFLFPILLGYFQGSISNNAVLIIEVFSCVYFLYGLAFLSISWIDEAFDLFILTDQRLVDVTQVNFFKRMVATTPLSQIQDSTSHVDGFLKTLLGYGDVEVQTAAGAASTFFIDQVPRPDQVVRTILEAQKMSTC